MLSVTIKKQLAHYMLDVQFTVRDEIIVLAGPSGSGKTTILHCIAGLMHPDSGQISLNGECFFANNIKPAAAKKRGIGYLFQDYALFPHMTVEKNIYYGVKDQKGAETAEMLLDVLSIGHLLQQYPNQISGGEKQRVALARALATEPSALLLDEPLSALDKETRRQCQDELLRLHRLWKIPFIIVTHDIDEAKKMGDRLIQLKEGKIINDD